MKKAIALLLALVMVFSMVACASSSANKSNDKTNDQTNTPAAAEDNTPASDETTESGDASGDTVKIGVLLPFSGASAATGELQMRGFQMYVDRVNARGGIQSLGGAKIELVKADTTGSPEVGVTEMERLIAENPDMAAIVGPYQSGVGSATVPIAEKYGVPYVLSNCTTDSVLGDPNIKYSFRPNLSNIFLAYGFIDLINAFNEIEPDSCKRVAILYESSDWGVGVYENLVNIVMPAVGAEVVVTECFDTGVSDFSAMINKLKAADVDLVFPLMYLSDAILFVNQMHEYDCNVPMMAQGAGFLVNDFIPSVGDLSNYIFSACAWIADMIGSRSEEAQKLAADYKAEYGSDMTEYEVNGWLAMAVAVDALERSGSTDHDALAEALLATDLQPDDEALMFHDYAGVQFGEMEGMVHQNVKANACFVQCIDGEYKYITTTADDPTIVWPVPGWSER